MKIGHNSSGALNWSFKYKVIAGAVRNVDRIEFAFTCYGKYPSIGVRGTKPGIPVIRGPISKSTGKKRRPLSLLRCQPGA
ncbi:MAG: hypothetical protein WCO44_07830 [Bacteroidota bacterium]